MNYSDYYEEMRSYKTIERYIKDNSALVRGVKAGLDSVLNDPTIGDQEVVEPYVYSNVSEASDLLGAIIHMAGE